MSGNMHDEQEKLKAAYALNMCTVSVSQIVDYNDEYILEQEYEAILNNLNLEQIPKDEALLNILVKLLNVITFFRIDKVKKEQIEKKYQRRMKNAIWSAVPNIGLIVAKNPITMGLSLATQFGTGYMNYRREKANALADKEDSEVELRITAMEQLNALRRELFTTAWRLADEYQFPDRYRLTERQITQYNEILMDTDEIRKYERLTYVQDKFDAYPPFWYFMGHSAKYIAEDKSNCLEPSARLYYLNLAKKHFEKYDRLNSFNILREDELTASFALEYVDLLMLEENPDEKTKEKIARLIKTAVDMAGNAKDTLELCTIAYLKIGQTDDAKKLLRMLVNENYNTAVNAKLLSRIYVSEILKGSNPLARTEYRILSTRVAPAWLFPMPGNNSENLMLQDKNLQKKYLFEQKYFLRKEYEDAITQFIEKYIILFNKVIPVPVENASDEYFLNTKEALEKRQNDVSDALKNDKGNEYRKEIKESGFRFRFVELLNKMLNDLDGLRLFRDSSNRDYMVWRIRGNLKKASGDLKKIQDKLNDDNCFTADDYKHIQNDFSFKKFTEDSFKALKEDLMKKIAEVDSLDMLDDIEFDLVQFCREQGIPEKEPNPKGKICLPENDGKNGYIPLSVLGENEHDESFDKEIFAKMLSAVKEASDSIVEDTSKAKMIVCGDPEFDLYFENDKLHRGGAFKAKTLAVLDDRSHVDSDLFITRDGVAPVKHNKIDGLRRFDRIEYQGKSLSIGWPEEYSNKAVNLGNLYSLLKELEKIRNGSGMQNERR